MDSKIFREAALAYQAVYDEELRQEIEEQQAFENWVNSLVEEGYDLSEYTWEDMYEEYLDEMGQKGGGRVTGSNPNVYKPATTTSGPAGGGMNGMRGTGRNRNASQTSSSPGALRVTPATPAAKPAAKPAPTAPATKPTPTAATKPTPTAAAKPAAAKPAPSAAAKPYSGPGYKKDTSVTDMIGRSQIRQGAPINTGNKSSDIRSMALRSSDVGGSGGSTPKPAAAPVNKATGSKKPGSIVSGFDMFDIVKGHLLDEGYAETEDAAIAIMANMSEEWKLEIIGEASSRDEFTRAAIARNSGRKGGITFEPGPNWDPSANRGKGAHLSPKQKEKQRRKALRQEEFELWVNELVEEGYDLSDYTWEEMFDIYEAEGSYGETPKAYSAALKTKMTAKRKPFLKAMQRRTNPANRKDAYASPRKGMTASDREEARAGAAHGVGTRQGHDYPSQGPGGVTKNPKKLRKQKAMGEHD